MPLDQDDPRVIHPLDIGYDLRKPCSECPFRKDIEHHEGIASGLVNLFGQMEMGRAIFTCHKTDPRADGFKHGYHGEIQHCGGFMLMQAREKDHQAGLSAAVKAGIVDLEELSEDPRIFTPIEMIQSYADWGIELLDKRQIQAAVSDAESEGMPAQDFDID